MAIHNCGPMMYMYLYTSIQQYNLLIFILPDDTCNRKSKLETMFASVTDQMDQLL